MKIVWTIPPPSPRLEDMEPVGTETFELSQELLPILAPLPQVTLGSSTMHGLNTSRLGAKGGIGRLASVGWTLDMLKLATHQDWNSSWPQEPQQDP